ncbi:hypothetical protein EB001_15515 [bacterium]|nr:hypothetical protein [bacterium]
MKAQIIKIIDKTSRFTGKPAHMVCYKCEDGKSRTSWVDEGNANWLRWYDKLQVGNTLGGLNINAKGYIDADSFPEIIKEK